MYTATIVPYKAVFMIEEPLEFFIFDILVDVLFLCDIIITCFLAYYDKENDLITSRRTIFLNYLSGWMIIDILGILPISYFTGDGKSYNNLIRISRLPRLFKLVKLTRLSKIQRNIPLKSKFAKGI